MAKHKKPAVDPALVARAKATAWLQTNGEASTLTQLLRGAASDYAGQVAVERGAARGVAATANAAIPRVEKYYKQADQTRAQAQTFVDRHLQGLSPIADDIRAGSAAEAAGFMRRLGETRAATLGEFQSRKVDAKAGAAFAVRSATDRYRQDSGDIKRQITQLQRRKGVITTVALNDAIKAEEEAAKARRSENRLNRASVAGITGIDPKTGKPTLAKTKADQAHADKVAAAAAKAAAARKKHREEVAKRQQEYINEHLGGPRKPQSQSSYNFHGTISDVQGLIHGGDSQGLSDHQIRANLLDGKNPSGKKYGRDAINAAFDLARKGYLSAPNVAALRRRGVRVPKRWRAPNPNRVGAPGIPHSL